MLDQIQAFSPEGAFDVERAGKGFACGLGAFTAVLWASRRLGADNASGLAEVNELIVQQEVIATGLEPAVVRQRIHARSTRAQYPSRE